MAHNRASPTFAEAWRHWLAYRAAGARPLRASTAADYASIYRRHLGPALGDMRLDQIDGTTIAQLTIALSATGISGKRISNVLVPLRACLRWHHRLGIFERDPGAWFDPPSIASDERRILTPSQVAALVAAVPAHFRPHIVFAAYTGVRAGELRALTWPDVDLAARTARIDKTYYRDQLQHSTKSGHNRTIPLPRHVATMLAEWQPRCPVSTERLVFPAANGRVLDMDNFRTRIFNPAAKAAGLDPGTRFHDLRHTSASLYLQTGATIREVMEIHGWRQMQTALRYLHTGDSLLTAADRLSDAVARSSP